jgi:hypothetical protein
LLDDSNRLDVTTLPPPAGRNVVGTGGVVSRAVFEVAKDFTDDNPASVTMSLSCTSGTVSPPVQVSEGNPQTLEVIGFETAPEGVTACTVSESGLPEGYYQKSATPDCAIAVVEHDGNYPECVIENAPLRATFEVTKNFTDDNPADVEVSISCNTGLPLEQTTSISEVNGGVTFVVTDFQPGAMNCRISEMVPIGYEQAYSAEGTSASSTNQDGCSFTQVQGGNDDRCEITNTLLAVDVEVHKEWIDEHPELLLPTWVEVHYSCNAPIFKPFGPGADGSDGDTYQFSLYISPNQPGVVEVFPHWDGSTTCSVTETPQAGVIHDSSACEAIPLSPGQGGTCTIVNTRFFEGIPALGRNSLALLVLLITGIGLMALRRWV